MTSVLIGDDGFRRILGHPAVQNLTTILEIPGTDGVGVDDAKMDRIRRLHRDGLALRG